MAMPLFPDRRVVVGCHQHHRRAGDFATGDQRFGERGVAHHLVCAVAEPAAEAAWLVVGRAECDVVAAAILAVMVGELEASRRITAEGSGLAADLSSRV